MWRYSGGGIWAGKSFRRRSNSSLGPERYCEIRSNAQDSIRFGFHAKPAEKRRCARPLMFSRCHFGVVAKSSAPELFQCWARRADLHPSVAVELPKLLLGGLREGVETARQGGGVRVRSEEAHALRMTGRNGQRYVSAKRAQQQNL